MSRAGLFGTVECSSCWGGRLFITDLSEMTRRGLVFHVSYRLAGFAGIDAPRAINLDSRTMTQFISFDTKSSAFKPVIPAGLTTDRCPLSWPGLPRPSPETGTMRRAADIADPSGDGRAKPGQDGESRSAYSVRISVFQ